LTTLSFLQKILITGGASATCYPSIYMQEVFPKPQLLTCLEPLPHDITNFFIDPLSNWMVTLHNNSLCLRQEHSSSNTLPIN
jgi:hypothetical protein